MTEKIENESAADKAVDSAKPKLSAEHIAIHNTRAALLAAKDNLMAASIHLQSAGAHFSPTWKQWYEIIGDLSVTSVRLGAMLPKPKVTEHASEDGQKGNTDG